MEYCTNPHISSKSSEINDIGVQTKKTINPYRPRLVEEGLPISHASSSKNITGRKATTQPDQRKKSTISLRSLAKKNNFNRSNDHRTRYSDECLRKSLSYSTHLVIGVNDIKTTTANATSTSALISNDSVHQNISNQDDLKTQLTNLDDHSAVSSPAQLVRDKKQQYEKYNFPNHDNHDDRSMNMDIDSFDDSDDNMDYSSDTDNFNPTAEMIATQTPFTAQTMFFNTKPLNKTHNISQEMNNDQKAKSALIVLDGANIAYAYSDAMGCTDGTIGIDMAVQYFLNYGLHALAVLPAHWARIKPKTNDLSQENAMMQTRQLEVLTKLKKNGNLCLCPPADDDDAYIIDIARKADKKFIEEQRKHNQFSNNGTYRFDNQGSYIVSCDMFRDAIQRDRQRRQSSSLDKWMKKRRISYIFYQNDMLNHEGNNFHNNYDSDLKYQGTFIPNPRHELIIRLNEAENDFDIP